MTSTQRPHAVLTRRLFVGAGAAALAVPVFTPACCW